MHTHTPFTNLAFCIRTFGCQMNKHDSERVAGMLEGLGALPVDAIEDADLVVFMTCCVREAADTRLYGQVASLKNTPLRADTAAVRSASWPWAAASGSATAQKLVDELPHLDVVFGTHNLGSLPRLIEEARRGGRAPGGGARRRLVVSPPSCRPRASTHWAAVAAHRAAAATTSAPTASCPTCAAARSPARWRISWPRPRATWPPA